MPREIDPHMCLILACSKLKVPDATSPALDMYRGSIFKKGRAIGEVAGLPMFILSAKYGFLKPDTVIDNYDQKFKKPYNGVMPDRPWHGFYLGGQLYFKNMPKAFKPLVPSMQMGYMLKALKHLEDNPHEVAKMIEEHKGWN